MTDETRVDSGVILSYTPPRPSGRRIAILFLLMALGISAPAGIADAGFDFLAFAYILAVMLCLSLFPAALAYGLLLDLHIAGAIEVKTDGCTLTCKLGRDLLTLPMEEIEEIECHAHLLLRFIRIRMRNGRIVDVGWDAPARWVSRDDLKRRAVILWSAVRKCSPDVKLRCKP